MNTTTEVINLYLYASLLLGKSDRLEHNFSLLIRHVNREVCLVMNNQKLDYDQPNIFGDVQNLSRDAGAKFQDFGDIGEIDLAHLNNIFSGFFAKKQGML